MQRRPPRTLFLRRTTEPRYVASLGFGLRPSIRVRFDTSLERASWRLPQARLAAIWRRAMDHLRPSGVFARRFLAKGNNRHVNFARGKACEIPRAE